MGAYIGQQIHKFHSKLFVYIYLLFDGNNMDFWIAYRLILSFAVMDEGS